MHDNTCTCTMQVFLLRMKRRGDPMFADLEFPTRSAGFVELQSNRPALEEEQSC